MHKRGQGIQPDRAFFVPGPQTGPAQGRNMPQSPQSQGHIPHPGPDVSAFATTDFELRLVGLSLHQPGLEHLDLTGLQDHLFPVPGQVVGPLAIHLDGAIGRGDLVQVYEARLIEAGSDQAVFEILCGKGTYVRSWVRDIAQALGTLGYVSQLRRTRIGGFLEKDSVGLETLTPFMHSPAAFAYLKPLSTALDGIPALAVTGSDTVRLRSGNPILIRANLFARMKDGFANDGGIQGQTVFLTDETDAPVALAEIADGELRPFRVFQL